MRVLNLRKLTLASLCAALFVCAGCRSLDPLPSWREGGTKRSILTFVDQAADPNSGHYIAPADRIATLDNDGTLWVEQPMYVYVLFAAAQMKAVGASTPNGLRILHSRK